MEMEFLKDAEESLYQGEFQNDLPHGIGTQEDVSGSRYYGAWQSGLMHGQGKLDFGDGNSFSGEFEMGRAVDGIYYWQDGRTSRSFQDLDGNWKDFTEL